MNRREIDRLDRELSGFIDSMVADMGRPERRRAMKWYIVGLLLDGERKSIEPMAARLVDEACEIEAMRQRLQQAVSVSTWLDDELYCRIARKLDGELPGVEAMVVDDTGYAKKGIPFRRRAAAVFGHAGAHRQLPGCSEPPSRRRIRFGLHRNAAVSPRGVGK